MDDNNTPPQRFKNIGWFLAGYNYMRGNPFDNRLDPGFTRSNRIFQGTYDENQVTADGLFEIPDGIAVDNALSCQVAFSSEGVKTSAELSTKYSTKASAKGGADFGAFKAKFGASAGFQASSKLMATSETTEMYVDAECHVYTGGLKFNKPKFTKDFVDALEDLPEEYKGNEHEYKNFLELFGTHYVHDATMGASYGRSTQISKHTVEAMASLGYHIGQSASAAAKGVAFDNEFKTEMEAKMAAAFEKNTENHKFYSRGATVSEKWEDWAKQVLNNPFILEYNLRRIDSLQRELIKHINYEKFMSLRAALNDYCTQLKKDGDIGSCEAPPNTIFQPPTPAPTQPPTGPPSPPTNPPGPYTECNTLGNYGVCAGTPDKYQGNSSPSKCASECQQQGYDYFVWTNGYGGHCWCYKHCTALIKNNFGWTYAIGANACPAFHEPLRFPTLAGTDDEEVNDSGETLMEPSSFPTINWEKQAAFLETSDEDTIMEPTATPSIYQEENDGADLKENQLHRDDNPMVRRLRGNAN